MTHVETASSQWVTTNKHQSKEFPGKAGRLNNSRESNRATQ